MRVYHQGQLDFFCAIYAVLNALGGMYKLSLSQARGIFAETMTDLAGHPELWQAVLYNRTDFYWLVPYMLARIRRKKHFPFRVQRPFCAEENWSLCDAHADLADVSFMAAGPPPPRPESGYVWERMGDWLGGGDPRRCLLLRFHRYIACMPEPIVSHWTAASSLDGDALRLRDASKDEGALHSLVRHETGLTTDQGPRLHMVLLEPASLFFLERV